VAPDGTLHAVASRGLFTGNRGVIHDPQGKVLTGRRWTTMAWIACSLDWKGKRREVWGKNGPTGVGWSELFFLDEVTALAAGHRPCFFCRRHDARLFADACGEAGSMVAGEIDAILHRERRLSARSTFWSHQTVEPSLLPDGVIIETPRGFAAVRGGHALPWHFTGYGRPFALTDLGSMATLVTPRLVVAALAAGYRPVWHPSALS
jgi:hypothetical protein